MFIGNLGTHPLIAIIQYTVLIKNDPTHSRKDTLQSLIQISP